MVSRNVPLPSPTQHDIRPSCGGPISLSDSLSVCVSLCLRGRLHVSIMVRPSAPCPTPPTRPGPSVVRVGSANDASQPQDEVTAGCAESVPSMRHFDSNSVLGPWTVEVILNKPRSGSQTGCERPGGGGGARGVANGGVKPRFGGVGPAKTKKEASQKDKTAIQPSYRMIAGHAGPANELDTTMAPVGVQRNTLQVPYFCTR